MNENTIDLGSTIGVRIEEIRFRERGKGREYSVKVGGEVIPIGGFENLFSVKRFAARLAEYGFESDLGCYPDTRAFTRSEWAACLPLAMREAIPEEGADHE